MPIEESPTTEETSPDNDPLNSDFEEDFRSLGQDLAETDVAEWLTSDDQDPGYEHFDDNAIVDLVLNSNQEQMTEVDFNEKSEIDEASPCPISDKVAMEMLDKCLTWLQYQPEASAHNASVLLSLNAIAAKKRFTSMKQKAITSFFNKTQGLSALALEPGLNPG